MSKGSHTPNSIDRARDELFSHIRRCGVLDAETDQRGEWFDDTIQYLGERYPELTPGELSELRTIGERYCAPPIPHGNTDALTLAAEEPEAAEEADAQVAGVEPTSVVAVEAADPDAGEPADVAVAAVELAETSVEGVEVAEADEADVDVAETGEVSAA